jgi:hypothetical protein
MKYPETINNKIKQFNPDECLFIGTINELQQTLQETIRARINAENKLATMNKNNETYYLYKSYLKLCKKWEESLTEELIKRMPEDQQVLS